MLTSSDIQNEHDRMGYGLGWRFMSCPERQMTRAHTALVFLNPGGARDDHNPNWDQPIGNSYWVESWRGLPAGTSLLQKRVQHLARVIGLRSDDIFSANFVPFRSKSWASLPHKTDAIEFSRRLWSGVLPVLSTKRFICVGKTEAGKNIVKLLDARFADRALMGWGNQTYDLYRTRTGDPVFIIPHLSRFSAMGDPHREKVLRTFIETHSN